jgi:DNA-binding response OmpR family regulator
VSYQGAAARRRRCHPEDSRAVAKRFRKKFEKVPNLGSDRPMATIHAFGPFRLDTDAEILFRGSEPLPISKRAIALLRVLVERAGAPVSKDTLIDAVNRTDFLGGCFI